MHTQYNKKHTALQPGTDDPTKIYCTGSAVDKSQQSIWQATRVTKKYLTLGRIKGTEMA